MFSYFSPVDSTTKPTENIHSKKQIEKVIEGLKNHRYLLTLAPEKRMPIVITHNKNSTTLRIIDPVSINAAMNIQYSPRRRKTKESTIIFLNSFVPILSLNKPTDKIPPANPAKKYPKISGIP